MHVDLYSGHKMGGLRMAVAWSSDSVAICCILVDLWLQYFDTVGWVVGRASCL